jgi:hypothetical protein
LGSIREYNPSCFFRLFYVHFRFKFEFYNGKGQNKGCCPLTLWFTLILSGHRLVVGFVSIEIISFHLYLIALPSWRGYLAENLCSTWAILFISLATISCYGLLLLLDEEVRRYPSRRPFLAFMVDFLGEKEFILLMLGPGKESYMLLLIFLVTMLLC